METRGFAHSAMCLLKRDTMFCSNLRASSLLDAVHLEIKLGPAYIHQTFPRQAEINDSAHSAILDALDEPGKVLTRPLDLPLSHPIFSISPVEPNAGTL